MKIPWNCRVNILCYIQDHPKGHLSGIGWTKTRAFCFHHTQSLFQTMLKQVLIKISVNITVSFTTTMTTTTTSRALRLTQTSGRQRGKGNSHPTSFSLLTTCSLFVCLFVCAIDRLDTAPRRTAPWPSVPGRWTTWTGSLRRSATSWTTWRYFKHQTQHQHYCQHTSMSLWLNTFPLGTHSNFTPGCWSTQIFAA